MLKKLKYAGSIAREAREFGVAHAKAGTSALELADSIERVIRSKGAQPAFPVNIGVNEVAAHYTPSKTDDILLRLGDVVKIDVGTHVDGFPADTSATVEIGTANHSTLISSADAALRMCVEMIAPGVTISQIGESVEKVIKSAGYKPVENLTGHSMEQFNLHAGLSIPSIRTRDKAVIEKGMLLAIEPFSTTGSGRVKGSGKGNIYKLVRDRRAPPDICALFSRMQSRFNLFPFASRWCDELHPEAQALIPKMHRMGMIMNYPVLTEVSKGVVAQAEHSVLVTEDGCVVLT